MRVIIVLLLSTLLIACGNSRVNHSNYVLVDTGMHYNEIKHMLGEPDWCDDRERPRECRWGNERKNIEINFVARRVVAKQSTGL